MSSEPPHTSYDDSSENPSEEPASSSQKADQPGRTNPSADDSSPILPAEDPANLRLCFDRLSREQDSILLSYRLLQEAKAWDVPPEKFEHMFHQYCRERSIVRKPLDWLRKLAELLGQFSILFGLVLFITEADSRKQQANDQAWSIIIAAQRAQDRTSDAPGDASHLGRITALEALNQGCREQQEAAQRGPLLNLWPGYWPLWRSKCATLRGLWLNGIYLPAIQLPWANLRSTNFRNAGLWAANFEKADLSNAILEGAQLNQASLAGANLTGTSLSRSNLRGADFTNTILLGTDLTGVRGLTPRQLQPEGITGAGPLICRAILPTGFTQDVSQEQKDCQAIPKILINTYPNQFDNLEAAQELVDSYQDEEN